MTSPKHAAKVATLLRRATDVPSEPGPAPHARVAAISAIERALEARRQALRTRRTRRIFAALTLAAGLSLAAGAAGVSRARSTGHETPNLAALEPRSVTLSGQGEVRQADGAPVPVPAELPLAPGARVETPARGSVRLAFATGTELELAEQGAVEIAENGRTQAFRLVRGALHAKVAKLADGQRFLVRTADLEVEVRGTRFSVSVAEPAACAGGVTTRVHVEEGLVVVRASGVAEVGVAAGQSWPPCATTIQASAPSSTPSSTPSNDRPVVAERPSLPLKPGPTPAATHTPPPAPAPEPGSSLAEQNTLYERALGQRRAGARAEAVATLEQLLARYPAGPLAESASAERMRLLAKQGSPHAPGAARAYLAAYPNGFARADALAIAGAGR